MSNTAPFDPTDPAIRKLIARAKRLGFITFDQLNEGFPHDKMSSEQIEEIMSAINDMGVQIVEDEQKFTDKEVFERRRAAFDACVSALRDAAAARWGILTREEVVSAQCRYELDPAQIAKVQDWLDGPPKTHVVAESDLVDNMPSPGVMPRRSYSERIGENAHDDPKQLEISLDEIAQFGRRLENARQNLGITNPNALLTLGDLAKAEESFDDLFWVAGMQSTVSKLAMKRLAGFVAAVSLKLACGLRTLGEDDTEFSRSWRAGQDFVQRDLDVRGYVRELRVGQQAWLRHSGKMPIGTEFPWVVPDEGRSFHLPTAHFDAWQEWAECVAWYVAEVRAIHEADWKLEGSWELNMASEREFSASLARWFDPSPSPPFPTMDESWANFAGTVHRRDPQRVSSASPFWTTISVFPASARRIERLDVDGLTEDCCLPYSLESIGTLALYRQAGSFTIPSGVREIDEVVVDECSLYLPSTVKRIVRLELHLQDDCFWADGVEEYEVVQLTLSNHTFAHGVKRIGRLETDGSVTILPGSLQEIDEVEIEDTFAEDYDDDFEPRSLHWHEGPTRVGSITLGENISTSLPKSLQTIGRLRLGARARLQIFATTIVQGDIEMADDATIERVELD